MSLITCCPACGTMFRVVPDQLKISEGWVRCGHCAEVFDAPAHMVAEPPAAPAAPVETDTQPQDELTSTAPETSRPAAAAAPSAFESDLRESELDRPFVFRRSDLGRTEGPAWIPSPVPESLPPPSRRSRAEPQEDEEPSPEDVTFLRQARRQAFWQRRRMRAMLVLVVVLLAVLLAAQYAVQERDRLAQTQPALHPVLERLCEFAGCRIEPVRDIEAIAIDSSAFNKLRTDAYRLSFTLRNNSTLPLAMPAMELTLTDGQDVPLLRRVLLPADLGAQSPTIGAGADWSASVAVAVHSTELGPRVAGYRLLAFYP